MPAWHGGGRRCSPQSSTRVAGVPDGASGGYRGALATVALTTLIVNSRHVFYALSFPLHRVRGRAARAYSTYTLSDEAFAVAVSPEARTWTTRPLLLMQVSLHLLW